MAETMDEVPLLIIFVIPVDSFGVPEIHASPRSDRGSDKKSGVVSCRRTRERHEPELLDDRHLHGVNLQSRQLKLV